MEEKFEEMLSEDRRNFIQTRYEFDPLEVLKIIPGKYGKLVINMAICYQSLYKRCIRLFSEVGKVRDENKSFEESKQKKEDEFCSELSELKMEIMTISENHKILLKIIEETNIRMSRMEKLLNVSVAKKSSEEKKEDLIVENQQIRIDKLLAKVIAMGKTVCKYQAELKKKVRDDKKEREKIMKSVKKYNDRLRDIEKFVDYSSKEKEKIKKEKVYLLNTGDPVFDKISGLFFWRDEGTDKIFV